MQQRSPFTPKRCALSLCRPAHCGSPFPSSGFLRGEQSAEPQLIAFHPCFQKGALLTVCWSTGTISHIPFFFLSTHVPYGSPGRSPAVVTASSSVREQPLFSEL